MIRSILSAWMLPAAFACAQAAVLVTSEGNGETSQQYFEDGAFVLLQGGSPAFGIDEAGNCWFVERDRLIIDPCEQILDSMSGMREQAMAGMSQEQRAMMQQMMGMQARGDVSVKPAGNRRIAGYDSSCHVIGGSREVCISEDLLREIKGEMGSRRFTDMLQRFEQSGIEMGGAGAEAVGALFKRGYPMSDMRKSSAVPGLNPAMMQYIPEAQRAQIMQQIGAGAMAQQEQGSRVIAVDKHASMPNIDLSRFQRMNFGQFMQQTMGQMPPVRH